LQLLETSHISESKNTANAILDMSFHIAYAKRTRNEGAKIEKSFQIYAKSFEIFYFLKPNFKKTTSVEKS
jgi:hypothetical protein